MRRFNRRALLKGIPLAAAGSAAAAPTKHTDSNRNANRSFI